MALTDIKIRSLKPTGKAFRVRDGDGLFMLVSPTGGRLWRFRYRFDGKEKSLGLGVYPRVSLKDARKRRDNARDLLDDGRDPSAERKTEKVRKHTSAENSFEAVALEWHKQNVHTWTPGYWKKVLRRLEMNMFPALGKRPITEIEAPELLAVARKIEKRGAFDLAHKMTQAYGQIARYAIATGRLKSDVSRDLRGALTTHKKKHQPAVKPEELPDLLRAIAGYEEIGGEKQTRLALQLLTLTFVRTRELIEAEWAEINLDTAMWTIPAARMKMGADHVVPLARQSIAILNELKELAGGSRFVFPGRNRIVPMSNNAMLFALYRLGYRGRQTGHGFRTCASTILNEHEWGEDVVERQLAHVEQNEVRGAYNRAAHISKRVKMMQWYADYIDATRDGGTHGGDTHEGKVIAFRRAS